MNLISDKVIFESLSLTRLLGKSVQSTSGHPKLPVQMAAGIKILLKIERIPLVLLLRSNLVKKELLA